MGEGFQFLEIVFFAMVAVFIILRLRNVLGRRTGNEPPPAKPVLRSRSDSDDENNVVALPDRAGDGDAPAGEQESAPADEVVAAAKFAPIGRRGMWTSRQGYGVDDYLKRANDETMIVCLIEDFDALPELDSILEVDQIDVLLVAQSDFSQSMGHIGNPGHPEAVAAIDETLKRIVASGTVAGTNVTAESAGKYVDMGVRFFYTNSADRFAAAIESSK